MVGGLGRRLQAVDDAGAPGGGRAGAGPAGNWLVDVATTAGRGAFSRRSLCRYEDSDPTAKGRIARRGHSKYAKAGREIQWAKVGSSDSPAGSRKVEWQGAVSSARRARRENSRRRCRFERI